MAFASGPLVGGTGPAELAAVSASMVLAEVVGVLYPPAKSRAGALMAPLVWPVVLGKSTARAADAVVEV